MVVAYAVMAYIFMAYIVMAMLYSYGHMVVAYAVIARTIQSRPALSSCHERNHEAPVGVATTH